MTVRRRAVTRIRQLTKWRRSACHEQHEQPRAADVERYIRLAFGAADSVPTTAANTSPRCVFFAYRMWKATKRRTLWDFAGLLVKRVIVANRKAPYLTRVPSSFGQVEGEYADMC